MASDGTIKINTELDNSKAESAMSKFSSTAKTALKGVTVAAGAVGTAMAALRPTILPPAAFGPFPMDGGRGFPFSFKHPKIPMPRTGEGAPPARPWRSIRISNAEYIGTVGAMTLTSAGKGSVFFVVGCAYVWNRRILQL